MDDQETQNFPCGTRCDLAGIRISAILIVSANIIAWAVMENGYDTGKSVFKYSTYGGALLLLMGIVYYPILKRNPSDGILLSVALCLVAASANMGSHADVIEILAAIVATVIGPTGFIIFCCHARKQMR